MAQCLARHRDGALAGPLAAAQLTAATAPRSAAAVARQERMTEGIAGSLGVRLLEARLEALTETRGKRGKAGSARKAPLTADDETRMARKRALEGALQVMPRAAEERELHRLAIARLGLFHGALGASASAADLLMEVLSKVLSRLASCTKLLADERGVRADSGAVALGRLVLDATGMAGVVPREGGRGALSRRLREYLACAPGAANSALRDRQRRLEAKVATKQAERKVSLQAKAAQDMRAQQAGAAGAAAAGGDFAAGGGAPVAASAGQYLLAGHIDAVGVAPGAPLQGVVVGGAAGGLLGGAAVGAMAPGMAPAMAGGVPPAYPMAAPGVIDVGMGVGGAPLPIDVDTTPLYNLELPDGDAILQMFGGGVGHGGVDDLFMSAPMGTGLPNVGLFGLVDENAAAIATAAAAAPGAAAQATAAAKGAAKGAAKKRRAPSKQPSAKRSKPTKDAAATKAAGQGAETE